MSGFSIAYSFWNRFLLPCLRLFVKAVLIKHNFLWVDMKQNLALCHCYCDVPSIVCHFDMVKSICTIRVLRLCHDLTVIQCYLSDLQRKLNAMFAL